MGIQIGIKCYISLTPNHVSLFAIPESPKEGELIAISTYNGLSTMLHSLSAIIEKMNNKSR
jgi:hypothetical protein